jgi:predicted CXXCH cytochrome family protein
MTQGAIGVRTTLAFAVTVALMCFAATAYATVGDSGYQVWDPAAGDNPSYPGSPHEGFDTATQKCQVCHAPHNANPTGQALLPTTVAEACTYCHITTATGVVVIYDGDPLNYTVDNAYNHSSAAGATCTECHSPHGADTFGGIIAPKLLRRLPIQPSFVAFMSTGNDPNDLYNADGSVVFPPAPYDWQNWDPRWVQVTAFCTSCHPFFAQASEEDVTTNRMMTPSGLSTATVTFRTHPMKRYWGEGADENAGFVAQGSTVPTSTKVADMSTNGCQRCHMDGLGVDQGAGLWRTSFPHYTPDNSAFLIGSDDGGAWNTVTVPDRHQDATCFVCHRWGGSIGATEGVGIGY